MKINPSLLVSVLALILVGCASSDPAPAASSTESATPAVQVAYDTGTLKKGDQANCVICVTDEGTDHPETVAETLDYKGKTYAFCNESEKAAFISNPTKYVKK